MSTKVELDDTTLNQYHDFMLHHLQAGLGRRYRPMSFYFNPGPDVSLWSDPDGFVSCMPIAFKNLSLKLVRPEG